MRKLFLATVAVFLMAGLSYAVDVVLLRYSPDTKEVTVKEGDKEATYKIADNVKVTIKDKEGNVKEGTFKDLEVRLKFAGKGKAGGPKVDVTVKNGVITEVVLPGPTKKKKN
jgi:hypothetical protein